MFLILIPVHTIGSLKFVDCELTPELILIITRMCFEYSNSPASCRGEKGKVHHVSCYESARGVRALEFSRLDILSGF